MYKSNNRSDAINMRKSGMTLNEIADHLNVSKQRVAQYLIYEKNNENHRHFTIKPTACGYVALRKWMNERYLPMSALVVGMGYDYNPAVANSLKRKLTSEGGISLNISDIKKILKFTGMTFEECFGQFDCAEKEVC